MYIVDKLYDRVESKGWVCVGLDTSIDYIPECFKNNFNNAEDLLFNYNKAIIDATMDEAACYKVQIAYYEALGIQGLKAYAKTLKYLKHRDLISIGDIKRGDIKDTAKMYAKAHFEGEFEADFITLNPYMGLDSIDPYKDYIKHGQKGVFILLRTSNKGASDIQYLKDESGNRIYNIMGKRINSMGKEYLGTKGYSNIGAVVGCTHSEEAEKIRKEYDSTFFLIPGYGAQGGAAKDVASYLKQGNGGIVNSSRKILLAYKEYENREKEFSLCAREEVLRMKKDIECALRK